MTGRQWRYTCPQGHYSWQRRREGYYCMGCEEEFGKLVEASGSASTGFYYEEESGAWSE